MTIFQNRFFGALFAFIASSILMLVWYKFYLVNAEDYFISIWGDGFKNYYTFAYYVAHDHGTHFSGMNYPFGEHVVYTDDQPLLAFLFNFLCRFAFVRHHLHALFTYVTFLSVPLCSVVLFMLLAEYGVVGLYATMSSVFIASLSPQILRLSGHFGLAHCFFIPLAILLLTRASRSGRGFYLFLFSASALAFGLIHVYHLAIVSLFGVAYALVYYLLSDRERMDRIGMLKTFLASVAPFVALRIFMLLTDPVSDRPANPWGFFDTCSTVSSVMLTQLSFVYESLSHIIPLATVPEEKQAYIGILADIFLLLLIVMMVVKRDLIRPIIRNIPRPLMAAFLASLLLLLFAFGVPFTIPGCKWLYDYAGPFKQFRAPCRFSWVFYYMINIFSVVFVYHLVKASAMRLWVVRGMAVLIFALWFADVNMYNNHISKMWTAYGGQVDFNKEGSAIRSVLRANGFTTNDFQSILYLPYFNIGSEKTFIGQGGDVIAMKNSMSTGLSLIDIEMSRTSMSQTDLNLQLMSSPLLGKEIIQYFHSSKPLLLITQGNQVFNESESAIIRHGEYLGRAYIFPDSLSFYKLPISAFEDSGKFVSGRFDQMMAHMLSHPGYHSSDTADAIIFNGFDGAGAEHHLAGTGALYLESRDTVLFEGRLPAAKDSGLYEFSIWNYGDHRVNLYPAYVLRIFDSRSAEMAKYEMQGYKSLDVYKGWIRTNVRFILPYKGCRVRIEASGKYATYDEMMIRPMNGDILTQSMDKNLFMYNNYPIAR